ncbi:MAG: zinc-ribbon domain-containing protein [Paracoccaceae bacterium]|nr:zinc-ribbon domain-containing protein [Paracoccaceae bacterium]
MRLICPNCNAQYDVPDNAMLPGGRDVQCSNCEHTWYQDFPEDNADSEGSPPELAVPRQDKIPQPSESDASRIKVDPSEGTTQTVSQTSESALTPPIPSRKPLDPSVASVLQEEAQLEARARRSENAGPVETQPDLGLNETSRDDETKKRADKARARMIRPAPENTGASADETAVAVASTRRALLPDIQEINSTMRSNNDRSPNEDPGQTAQIEARERRGFARGFTLMVVLAAVLTLLYVMSPQVAKALPQAEAGINAYVATVDQGRAWLNGQIEAILTWLDTVIAPSGS